MSKILDKLFIASTGSGDSLSIFTSTASSHLLNISTATSSYDSFKIRSYVDTLTYNRDIITTYVGTGATSFNGENVFRTNYNVDGPANIAFDNDGNMYLSHSHRISKIDKITGLVTTITGSASPGSNSDCAAIDGRFDSPKSIVFDNDGNFFFADSLNKRIIKYTATASYVSTVWTSSNILYSIAINTTTNDLYASEYSPANVVKKITAPLYNSSTTVFSGGSEIFGIDYSTSTDTLYIADQNNNLIRKVFNGITTSIAGNGLSNLPIDGIKATFSSLNNPIGVKLYNNEIYICDRDNNRIRKVDSNGIITTIVGYTSLNGFYGEGISPLYAKLYNPYDIAFYDNDIYITDNVNNRVRKITVNTNPYTRTVNATASYLYYEKESNIFSVKGDGLVKLNGVFQLKDINFATNSYATNSLVTGNVSNYILQDGSKIESAWFKNTDFVKSGTMFWMEPGYSKTWQAYSYLGDVTKKNIYLTFSSNSLISFRIGKNNVFPGLSYSEIYNVILSSSGSVVNLPIFKTQSTNHINLNIDTSGSSLNSLDITFIGRNIIISTASFI